MNKVQRPLNKVRQNKSMAELVLYFAVCTLYLVKILFNLPKNPLKFRKQVLKNSNNMFKLWKPAWATKFSFFEHSGFLALLMRLDKSK